MRGRDETHISAWTGPSRAAAVVGLTVGLTACGAGAVRQSGSSSTTRLVVRHEAIGTPVRAEVQIRCATPISSSGKVATASATVQRFSVTAAPSDAWSRTVDVAGTSTCTVTDRPVPPAVLLSVRGGTAVHEGGHLVGVRTTPAAGSTVSLDLVAGMP